MAQGDGEVRVPRITDEDLVNSGPAVRALLVFRLEEMWKPVHTALVDDEQGLKPIDPRTQEIGLRIIRDLAVLYRLHRPPVLVQEEDDQPMGQGVDRYSLIDEKLSQIEAKIRKQAPED